MSYSGLGRALLLSAGLLSAACAHGTNTRPDAVTVADEPASTIEAGGKRQSDGPPETRLRAAFLAHGDSRRAQPVAGGPVIVERELCDVWSSTDHEQCDLERLVSRSMTPGYQP